MFKIFFYLLFIISIFIMMSKGYFEYGLILMFLSLILKERYIRVNNEKKQ